MVEAWNGTAWSVTSSPNPGFAPVLLDVSCTAPTNCVAVGSDEGASGNNKTLVESWNGTAWSVTSSPNEGGTAVENFLYGVSCTNSTNCVAVGYDEDNPSTQLQTLVESWNGTTWSVASSPNEGSEGDSFNSVACASSNSCVAAGYYETSSFVDQTLIETGSSTTPAPTITSFSPTSGVPGSVVTIKGTNLEDATSVTFNGVVVTTIKKDTATKIKVEVPTGATTGKIEVTTGGGMAKSANKFEVT